MRSTSGFQASDDPRVFYEPGAERLVPAVVGSVPGAVHRVEGAIVAEQRLTPEYARGRAASSFGLTPHMFYRQGSMFLAYLRDRHPEPFRRFVSSVEDGTEFQQSFEDAFGTAIDVPWRAFVAELAAGAPRPAAPAPPL
jgi:hypothetical protein